MSLKKPYIPLFEDELEMDDVLDSIAWDLCGLRPRTGKLPRKRPAKK